MTLLFLFLITLSQVDLLYDKETYNGDIGIIRSINEQDQEMMAMGEAK